MSINLVVSKSYARSEIYINRGDKDKNKEVFDFIFQDKDNIEKELGRPLEWERMDNKVTSRIKMQKNNLNVYEIDDQNEIIRFLINASTNMEKVFRKRSDSIKRYLKKINKN